MKKKTISLIMILCILISCVMSVGYSAQSTEISDSGSAVDTVQTGGIADPPQACEDGNILQCFNWTLKQIKDELPNISRAGFTSVQTSPLQAHNGNTKWYWLYQPNGFSAIGNELGSYNDLKALCTEANHYGIKIIVDVVANHVAGSNSGTWAASVESALRKTAYFHNLGACNDWNNRYDITHKNIGMPDLNSENTAVQDMVAAMVEKLQAAGVDGIRWDAAKHISLPSEDCAFWEKMSKYDLYQYGEILNSPAGDGQSALNKSLMAEYAQHMHVTDSKYSSTIMNAIKNGSRYRLSGYWNRQGVSSDRIVYWAESHDTYANSGTDGWTKNLDQNLIDRAYAILGAKADSQAMYLSRPFKTDKEAINYAVKGSTHFTSDEVAAVNHFHNAMLGTSETFECVSNCFIVWREGGAVIVSINSKDVDVSLTIPASADGGQMVSVGTYTDEVSGSSWTVTGNTLSGHIGGTGIAVVYNRYPGSENALIGDTNLNGEIEIDDATFIQRHLVSLRTLPAQEKAAGDADQDSAITLTDATALQAYLAGMTAENSHVGEPLNK